jgi:hypothetical protein
MRRRSLTALLPSRPVFGAQTGLAKRRNDKRLGGQGSRAQRLGSELDVFRMIFGPSVAAEAEELRWAF